MKPINLFFLAAIILSFGYTLPASEAMTETPAINLESEHDTLLAVDKAWSESVKDINAFLSFVADGAHFMPFGAPLARGDVIRTTGEGRMARPGFGLTCRRACRARARGSLIQGPKRLRY